MVARHFPKFDVVDNVAYFQHWKRPLLEGKRIFVMCEIFDVFVPSHTLVTQLRWIFPSGAGGYRGRIQQKHEPAYTKSSSERVENRSQPLGELILE